MRRRTFMFKCSATRFARECKCEGRLMGGPERWADLWAVYYRA